MTTARHMPEFDAASFSAEKAHSAFRTSGAVLLRGAVPAEEVESIRRHAQRFAREMEEKAQRGDQDVAVRFFKEGHGNRPWECGTGDTIFTAHLLHIHQKSFSWSLLETICGTTTLTVPLNHMILRRHHDAGGNIRSANGGYFNLESCHQDANNVNPELPVTIWTALQPMKCGIDAPGLGVITGNVDTLLSHPIDTAIFDDLRYWPWIPDYQAGDAMVFSCLAPHFSPVYRTGGVRFSIDFRVCSTVQLPENLRDEPAFHVKREDRGTFSTTSANLPPDPAGQQLASVLADPQFKLKAVVD